MMILALAIPWFAGVLLALLDGRRVWVGWLAVLASAATLAATAGLAVDVLPRDSKEMVAGGWPAGVGIVLRADPLGVAFALISGVVLLAALTFEVSGGVRWRSFPALVLFLQTGLTGLFLTGDAFNFYVFFEIAMISAYVLTGYGERRRQQRAAAIFAVVNLLGSVFFLVGIASLYHTSGRLDMTGIGARLSQAETRTVLLSATVIFVAFGVKLGLFPFHAWLAPVYTGTRPAVAAMLSGALANIGSYGLLRFGGELLPRELAIGAPALIALGIASVLYGGLQAVARRNIPEILAYSSIGQVGYIMIALGIGGRVGFSAAILFAIVNSLNKTLLFLSEHLRGWMVGGAFAIGAFSVAGIPPAAGFIGKAALLRAAIDDGSVTGVVLIVAGGALSLLYLFPAYQRRFWLEDDRPPSPLRTRLVVGVLALAILALGIWPQPLLSVSDDAASVLIAESP
jgi:multicomponent Na+:H+ antiporter subunit D